MTFWLGGYVFILLAGWFQCFGHLRLVQHNPLYCLYTQGQLKMEILAWKMDLPETYYETLDNFPHDTTVKSRLNERTWCKKYPKAYTFFFFHILPLKQNPTIPRTICSPLNKWFLIPEPEWGGRQRRYKTKYSLGNNRSMTYQGFFL